MVGSNTIPTIKFVRCTKRIRILGSTNRWSSGFSGGEVEGRPLTRKA